MDRVECVVAEFDVAGAAGDPEPVLHVAGSARRIERAELAAHRHALLELSHLRQLEAFSQLGLPDQYDLQELLPPFELREDPDLLEQRQRQVLRLVDHDDREALERRQRIEEVVERITELGARRAVEAAPRQIAHRHDAEVDEQRLQQVFAGDERIGDERRERPPIEVGEHRPAQRRLAGADLAAQDDEPFTPPDAGQQRVVRRPVGRASVQESWIGGEAEGLLVEAVERFVGQRAGEPRRGQ